LERMGVRGHEHDRFIYEIMVELAEEHLAAPTGAAAVDPLEAVVAPARRAYRAALEGAGPNPFEFAGHAFFVHVKSEYIFPAERMADADPEAKFHDYAYIRPQFAAMSVEQMAEIVTALASNQPVGLDELTMFLAATLAETHRNHVAEVTNRPGLAGDQDAKAFDVFPKTKGSTVTDPRDRSLDDLRVGSRRASGDATDREVAMAKDAFAKITGQDLVEVLTGEGATPSVRATVKDALRRAMYGGGP